MTRHLLRILNIPKYKTQNDLENEFRNIGIFDNILLIIKDASSDENAGYAFVEFNSTELLDRFAEKFHKLRKDIIIYR
jgi:hypothetical protein